MGVLKALKEDSVERFHGVAVIFDVEGFTKFCAGPQVEHRVAAFLNGVFGEVCGCLDSERSRMAEFSFAIDKRFPEHIKFLGDGALVIWSLPLPIAAQEELLARLTSRLFIARRTFPEFADGFARRFGLLDLPRRLRFGIASGEMLKLPLTGVPNEFEYAGFPINLASRLQGYCRHLGFLISARTGISQTTAEKLGLHRVIAKGLRGFPNEVVLVDEVDYTATPADLRQQLFGDFDED